MNHADMSVEDLRDLAGNADAIANLVQDLEAKTGIKFRLDLTGQPCVSFPLFPAMAVGEKLSDAEFAAALGCAPVVAEVAEPVKVEPAKNVPADPFARTAWTEAEDATLIAEITANPSMNVNALGKHISGKIDRTAGAISFRVGTKYADLIKPAPVALAASVAPTPAPAPQASEQPAWARHLHAHLDALGYPGEWTSQLDFEMLDRLGRGDKFGLVAAELEIEKPAALARYNALIAGALDGDGRFGFEAQKRLTSVLRERADAAKAQAA